MADGNFGYRGLNIRYQILKNEYDQADSFLLSFPKCGRTWVRYTLGSYFHYKYGVEKTHRLNAYKPDSPHKFTQRKKSGCPLVSFTHDYFSMADRITKKQFQTFEQQCNNFIFSNFYHSKPTVILFRDPVDAVVSFYYDDLRSSNKSGISMDDWFRHKTFGLNGVIKYFDLAIKLSEKIPNKLILSYENLKQGKGWSELINFITNGCDMAILEKSIEENKFDVAQKREKANHKKEIQDNRLFVRQGGSNYQESLSDEIKNYIDKNKNLNSIRHRLETIYGQN